MGTGSHKSLVTDLATRRSLPFTGAVQASYQVLGEGFVHWQLNRVSATPGAKVPSLAAAAAGFKAMGSRPEELLKALRQLQGVEGTPADQAFGIICQTLASANLIARPAHGRYAVVDPFVREVWRSRAALLLGAPEQHSGGAGEDNEPKPSAP